MKIECGITLKSSKIISKNIKYLKKLKGIYLKCRNKNKIVNEIVDDGCAAILSNSKYITNLEVLCLAGNGNKNVDRM